MPFAYHDGYLSVHFSLNKYQDINLTDLQTDAMWCVHLHRPGAALAEYSDFSLCYALYQDQGIIHSTRHTCCLVLNVL